MFKTQKLLFIILLGLLIIGCNPATSIPISQNPNQLPNSISVNFNNQFRLKPNDVALIASDNIKIKFLKVEEDSRCPNEVQCIWPGQVKVLVNVVKDEMEFGNLNLTSKVGGEDLSVKTFDGYSIKLIEVLPYPKKNQKLEISDYLVTLVVSQRSGV
ncbi:MAG: hypothetical protein WBA07_32545 [Rivularia sp. (in: cyanobacteria)]